MLDGAVIIKYLEAEFLIEGDVLFRVGEENKLPATLLPYVLFPVGDEFCADSCSLDGRVHRE